MVYTVSIVYNGLTKDVYFEFTDHIMINIQNAARVFTALEYRRRYFLLTKIVLLYMTLDIQQDERKIETIKPTNPAETARETL